MLCGMGIGTQMPPKVERCPRAYGFCISKAYQVWQQGYHSDTVVNSYTGRTELKDTTTWLVRQGDVILPCDPITKSMLIEMTFTPEHHRDDTPVPIKFVAAAATMQYSLPSTLEQAREGRLLNDTSEQLQLLIILRLGNHELKHMNIRVGNIPLSKLGRPTRKVIGGGRYFSVMVNAKIQVSTSVLVKIEFDNSILESYSTSL